MLHMIDDREHVEEVWIEIENQNDALFLRKHCKTSHFAINNELFFLFLKNPSYFFLSIKKRVILNLREMYPAKRVNAQLR